MIKEGKDVVDVSWPQLGAGEKKAKPAGLCAAVGNPLKK